MKTVSCIRISTFGLACITMGLALAMDLPAQSGTVLPKSFVKVEGSNSTSWPLGLGLPSRIQGLYDARLFGTKPPAIKSLSFRSEGNQALTSKKGVELEIRLSTSPVGAWNLDKRFAKNVGSDERVVFKKRRFDLPASSAKLSPQAFLVRFPLDSAFTYQQSKGSLLVEVRVFSIAAGNYELDASYTECVRHISIGKACGGFSQKPSGGLAVQKGTTTECGAQASDPFMGYALSGGHPGGVAFHIVSSQKLGAPITLPLGGCPLFIPPEVVLPIVLGKAGAARIRYPLSLFHGKQSFYSQFVSLDLGLTSFRSSSATLTRLGGWDAIARLVVVGKTTATTGFVQPGASWILQLGH